MADTRTIDETTYQAMLRVVKAARIEREKGTSGVHMRAMLELLDRELEPSKEPRHDQ